ncbi:mitochondrial ribosomal protein L4 [Brevipalpus obovatus]|uniref:mitochondrial ribosomal protein L4 n=1 Tax=Brevipalpus obovatus TaxID=246614 RepID=UPI003D9DEB1F
MVVIRQVRRYCSSGAIVLPREWRSRTTDIFNPQLTPVRQTWIYNFDSQLPVRLGITQLHPRIFSIFPRLDEVHRNLLWQKTYRYVDWLVMKTRAEFRTMNSKPWPQKGTGRARHGSRRSPQFTTGGWCFGPRGPTSYFFMLEYFVRVRGLMSVLAIKAAQNDLKIVDTLENFPSDDPVFIEEMMKVRGWGPSVLISDLSDIFPKKLLVASEDINHITLMKTSALNIWSMMKHETLVLTYPALREIEEKILLQWNRRDLEKLNEAWKPAKVIPDYPETDPWGVP